MEISSGVLIGLLTIHYLCDYSDLSTDKMLAAKKTGKPLLPILTHAYIHAAIMHMFLGLFCTTDNMVLLSCFLLQLGSHFLIDTLKGRLNTWVPAVSNPANRSHWYIFGLDQLLHQLVIVVMCIIVG